MGIRDRLVKALALPPGATTQTPEQIANTANVQGSLAAPLERDPLYGGTPFGPGNPLFPFLINQPRGDGRSDPRRWEFPVAWNLQITPNSGRNVDFKTLREIADLADIVRRCIEAVKSALIGMEWDIAINEDAIARVLAKEKIGNTAAAKLVREQFTDEIAAIKDFWRSPDRINGLSFQEWLGMLLEEVLVTDALSIYPNRVPDSPAMASLEILDGATIKPLLDARGSRPMPPHPAFQQILWGFPRGEFTASPDADGEFSADDLVYAPRIRRPFTPYGFSPVERALPLIDLYLKRLQWLRTEFTDGVPPDMLIETDGTYGNNPELLAGYERIFNDQLAGNMEERRHAKFLPNGMHPIFNPSSDAKFMADFDEFIVKSITGHFGILPSQIGFTPKHGLGGAGHQEGEALSTETLGLRPLLTWVSDLLNQLSHRFLGMPRDLTFVFNDGTENDMMQQATRRQLELFSGQKTWNEVRTEAGLPLFTFPEADSPIIVAGSTAIPLSATFEAVTVDAAGQDNDEEDATVGQHEDPAAGQTPLSDEGKAELAQFVKWAGKNKDRSRSFKFVALDADRVARLKACNAEDAVLLATMWKAVDARPKAVREPFPKGHPSRDRSDRLHQLMIDPLASLGSVDPDELVDEWEQEENQDDPVAWLLALGGVLNRSQLTSVLASIYLQAGFMGWVASQAMAQAGGMVDEDMVDWEGWEPGDDPPEFAVGPTLQQVIDGVDVRADGIIATRNSMVAIVLEAVAAGVITAAIAKQKIRDILNDEIKADVIAGTEIARGNDAATIDGYRAGSVTEVDWVTSGGNSCEECLGLEAGSPYELDEIAEEPPLHPNCGCQLVPVGDKALRATITKAGRHAVDRALEKLAELPDDEPGLIKVPWPRRDRPKVPNKAWADSHLQLWPIENLYATQKYVKRETVEWHLKNLGIVHQGAHSNPNILVVDGEPRIYDGHHRLVALWLLYVVATNCWTLEYE